MLTAEQVSQYRREGYTLCEEFLHKQEVITLLAEIEQVCKGNTLAHHDSARLEMEPSQASDGTLVRRLYEACTHWFGGGMASGSCLLSSDQHGLSGSSLLLG